jgi:hypothetical protein
MPATVTRISVTPVKGLALHHPDAVELTAGGVPGDRTFFLVDAGGHMVSATRLGALVSVRAEHDVDAGTLSLAFADGGVVSAPVEADEPVPVRFYGRPLGARPLRGPFSGVLSELVGHPVQLMLRPPTRPGVDRGARGAATLISSASLRALAAQAGVEDVDARRFRARGHDRRRPPASQRSCRPLRPHHAQFRDGSGRPADAARPLRLPGPRPEHRAAAVRRCRRGGAAGARPPRRCRQRSSTSDRRCTAHQTSSAVSGSRSRAPLSSSRRFNR